MNTAVSLPVRPERRYGLVGPALLVALGVLLLLTNLGALSWEVWRALVPWWPLVLIAGGLDLMFGRRSILASAAIVCVMLAVLGVLVWQAEAWQARGVPVATETVSQTLNGATNASLDLALGTGDLYLDSMPADTPGGVFVQGTLSQAQGQAMRRFDVIGGTATFGLYSRTTGMFPFGDASVRNNQVWKLRLNPDVPLAITASAGTGTATLNLRDLRVTQLTLNDGVGTTSVVMPRHGIVTATMHGGVGTMSITIPAGMAARISATNGLGRIDVSGAYERNGARYETPGYEQAADRLDLQVVGGVGNINITLEPGR